MAHEEHRTTAVENVLGVLRWNNARRLFSNVLKLEKNVLLGAAAELSFVAVLMVAAFLITVAVVLMRGSL